MIYCYFILSFIIISFCIPFDSQTAEKKLCSRISRLYFSGRNYRLVDPVKNDA